MTRPLAHVTTSVTAYYNGSQKAMKLFWLVSLSGHWTKREKLWQNHLTTFKSDDIIKVLAETNPNWRKQ
jgi:hypothetical protein